MAFQLGKAPLGDPNAAKRAALEAARAKAASPKAEEGVLIKYIPPAECENRLRVVFDDSGSMDGTPLKQAREGVVEMLRNCIPNTTSVAIHYMNENHPEQKELQSDLPALGALVSSCHLETGYTPLFTSLRDTLETTPRATRIALFTDGSPTDTLSGNSYCSSWDSWDRDADSIVALARKLGPKGPIPIDTIFFGTASQSTERQRKLLQKLSEGTGGIYMVFDPAKTNFATAFKYLAPVHRSLLTDGNFRKSLEEGRVK